LTVSELCGFIFFRYISNGKKVQCLN